MVKREKLRHVKTFHGFIRANIDLNHLTGSGCVLYQQESVERLTRTKQGSKERNYLISYSLKLVDSL